MGRLDYKICRKCGRPSSEVGTLSHTRQCSECAEHELKLNVFSLVAKTGPAWHRYRLGVALSVGVSPLDVPMPGQQTAA